MSQCVEWLINSFFTSCDWMIYIQQAAEGRDADIQMKEDVSMYRRRTTTLLSEFVLRGNSLKKKKKKAFRHILVLLFI